MASARSRIRADSRQLRAAGIFDAYRPIHRGLAARLGDLDVGMEALERALFLGWCDPSEPVSLTVDRTGRPSVQRAEHQARIGKGPACAVPVREAHRTGQVRTIGLEPA